MAERRWKLLILVTLFIQSHCLINELSNTESKDNSTASLQCSLLPRCSMPCAGAPPPRVCPAVVPKCKYGCACYTYCENGVPVLNDCFKTRDCIGKVSRSPPTILSKNKIGYTSKIYSEKTEVDHNEIPKYTSIPRRNEWFKFGLKGTPISALRPKAQRISEIKSNHANRNFTNYELEENAAAETIKIKAPRLINYEIQAHGSRPEISPSTCCSQEHIHNVGQKVSGRRGWIQKKYFVRKNVTFEGTFQNLAPTHNSLIRRTLPPKYLKNAFTDKIQVSNKRNSVGIWSPSKPTQRNDYSAINRVIHTNHCTIDGVQTEHSRRVRKNLYNHTWGPSKNKNVTMSQQIFTPSVYSYRILMRQGGPQSFNYGLRRQSFNSQHGRRYLGGILPKFNIANQAGSDQRIDKIIVQNMHIQRHHPKFIGSENQDDLVAWKKVKIHTPDRVTSPSTNIETDSNKESNKMLRVSIDQKLTPTTMLPRLMGGNQGNVVRYRNHAHDSNRIVPAQYHDPRTLRPNNENDLKIRPQSHEIIGQNDDERIKYSNNGIDPRIESINNRSVQNRNLILIPPGINAEFHPKVEDYSPITPARKRYKTRPPNQEFQSSRRIQPSNKGSKNNLQPVEGFRSDTDTDTDMVARAFLSK